uniref:Uncharacterized protein n=1 Tax=Oryzias sinensis TaxID=183150 RepID=A0A8C7WY50_9TELE
HHSSGFLWGSTGSLFGHLWTLPAQVTLLWEDQTRHHLLASARLYFLPEDTPKGRTREHGEDEVLAVSRKMVVRVEDLVRWSCATPASWSCSQKLQAGGPNGLHRPLQMADTPEQASKDAELQGVKVLSYPQYCRFRSLQRRIQDGARGPSLEDPHLLALGGVKVLPHTRLMYCRDTFNHPALESSASIQTKKITKLRTKNWLNILLMRYYVILHTSKAIKP